MRIFFSFFFFFILLVRYAMVCLLCPSLVLFSSVLRQKSQSLVERRPTARPLMWPGLPRLLSL